MRTAIAAQLLWRVIRIQIRQTKRVRSVSLGLICRWNNRISGYLGTAKGETDHSVSFLQLGRSDDNDSGTGGTIKINDALIRRASDCTEFSI